MYLYKCVLLLLCTQQALPSTLGGSKDAVNRLLPIISSSRNAVLSNATATNVGSSGAAPALPESPEDDQPKCGKVGGVCFPAFAIIPPQLLNRYPVLQSLKCCSSFCFPIPNLRTLGVCMGMPGDV